MKKDYISWEECVSLREVKVYTTVPQLPLCFSTHDLGYRRIGLTVHIWRINVLDKKVLKKNAKCNVMTKPTVTMSENVQRVAHHVAKFL